MRPPVSSLLVYLKILIFNVQKLYGVVVDRINQEMMGCQDLWEREGHRYVWDIRCLVQMNICV